MQWSWIRQIIGLWVTCIVASLPIQPLRAQSPASVPNIVDQLMGSETPADTDIVGLRQQVLERVKSKADAIAVRRPPIAPQLLKLPQVTFNVVFDPDSSLIRPQSYQTIGRIADALSNPRLLPYTFLVIAHTESTGRRDVNLTLSQRRADSIREVLATTFKISPKRLQSLGLGEEQLQDSARPTLPLNGRAQIVTTGNDAAPVPAQPPPKAALPAKKSQATYSKKRR